MRLINTITLEFEEFEGSDIPAYAILSHRWEKEEVLFKDVERGVHAVKKGWDKIARCCEQARYDDLDYAWVDTCCIDKSSSAELSEAINSMFKWYQRSIRCYVYLSDVRAESIDERILVMDEILEQQFRKSIWFKRGWTLQELIAPSDVQFFDRDWRRLGTKKNLVDIIESITSIPEPCLNFAKTIHAITVAERMSWASARVTTREEDRAYSLMGIFGVHMPMLYGEGKAAFTRLQEEILKRSVDESLLLWQGAKLGLLAPSPDAFSIHLPLNHRKLPVYSVAANEIQAFDKNHKLRLLKHSRERTSMGLTNIGLSITVDLIPWYPDVYLAMLLIRRPYYQPNTKTNTLGPRLREGRLGIFLRRSKKESRLFRIKFQHESVKCLPELTWGPLFTENGPQNPFMEPYGHIRRQVVVAFEPGPDISDCRSRPISFFADSLSVQNPALVSMIAREHQPLCDLIDGGKLVQVPGAFEVLAIIKFHKGFFSNAKDYFVYLGFDENFVPLLVRKAWHLPNKTFEDIHQLQSSGQPSVLRKQIDEALSAPHFLKSVKENLMGEIVKQISNSSSVWDLGFPKENEHFPIYLDILFPELLETSEEPV